MAINKVVANGNTLIDLTADTVDADHLAQGYTAHNKAGESITGTMVAGGGCNVGVMSVTPSSNSTSITFTGLSAGPKFFTVHALATNSSTGSRYVESVTFDGSVTGGIYRYQSASNKTAYDYFSNTYFSWTYSNGTLTVKTSSSTNGGYFKSGLAYKLVYAY